MRYIVPEPLTVCDGVEVEWAENFDLNDIVTPVKVDQYEQLLKETYYDMDKTEKLITGFRNGFSIQYDGPKKVKKNSPNLPLTVGSEVEIWNKVIKEVKGKRYAGPFEEIPYKYYIQSPIGLVPKDGGKKTRLIFHLSYPKSGESVNSGIPKGLCTVKYCDLMRLLNYVLEKGRLVILANQICQWHLGTFHWTDNPGDI